MCDLCDTHGREVIADEKSLRRAMAAITPDMIKDGKFTEHLRQLVDVWIGLEPELGSDDPEKAEGWERSHR
jgi:predicted Rossmann fold nucleotide-binding protein DprA/Smf involved in DNA uptake